MAIPSPIYRFKSTKISRIQSYIHRALLIYTHKISVLLVLAISTLSLAQFSL